MRTPRGFSAKREPYNRSSSLRSGNLAGNRRAKTNLLSHPPHGVLQPFELTFQIEVFDLVAIEVRVKELYGVDLRAASVTYGSLIVDIVEVNIRVARALQVFHIVPLCPFLQYNDTAEQCLCQDLRNFVQM